MAKRSTRLSRVAPPAREGRRHVGTHHDPSFPVPSIRFDKTHEERRKEQIRALNARTVAQYNEEIVIRVQIKALEQRKRELVSYVLHHGQQQRVGAER